MFKNTATLLKFSPVIILFAGLVLAIIFFVRSIPVATQSLFTKVNHPVDYSFTTYDKLLKENVKDGLVDYAALKRSKLLEKSLDELARTAPDRLDQESQFCYWVNAYNLLSIKIITDRYPIKILKDIGLDRASRKFVVAGKPITLQRLYSQKLKPIIYVRKLPAEVVFLICNGTMAYAPITAHAIMPKNLETDAKVAAYKYITNEKNVYFDDRKGVFYLSSLMNRYARKFKQFGHTPYSFCTLYLSPDKTPDLSDVMLTKTYFSKVDYRINDLSRFGKKPLPDEKNTQAKKMD